MALTLDGTTGISASGNIYGNNMIVTNSLTAGSFNPGLVSASGNVTAANLITGGLITASGNVSGSYFLGNGSLLTGIDATSIQNGTSNVKVVSSGGNATVSVGGTANVAVWATTGEYVTGLISASGNITGGNVLGGANVNATTHTGTTVSVTGNITGGNLNAAGLSLSSNVVSALNSTSNITTTANVAGSYFLGNGSLLTGIDATSIQNGTSNVKVVSSGGNVTVSVGGTANVAVFATTGEYVTGLISASGNITGANLTAGTITLSGNTISSSDSIITIDPAASGNTGAVIIQGNLSVTGNVTYIDSNTITTNDLVINMANNAATAAAANGGGIEVGPVTGAYARITYNSTGNIWVISNGANVTGLLSASGNVTGGNILTGGLISAAGNITGGNLILSGAIVDSGQLDLQTSAANSNIVFTPNGTGNVNTGANLSVTGNVQGGNLRTAGLISATGAITGASVVGGVMTGTSVSVSGAVTGASVVGGVMTGTSLSVSGAVNGAGITGTSLTVSTGTITGGNIVNANGTGVGNIGSSTVAFNTVFAKATSAQYADLAESYAADAAYAPGTVLIFDGTQEVTIATEPNDVRVAGVISTNPAHVMNAALDVAHVAIVALTGRVPTSVVGTVRKGAMMVSAGNGASMACATPAMGTVIGKSLENFDGESGVIEIVVGRL